jgi:hypothetical protein
MYRILNKFLHFQLHSKYLHDDLDGHCLWLHNEKERSMHKWHENGFSSGFEDQITFISPGIMMYAAER